MSKFLKFIVHLIVICAIVCALGLTIPPFFGVNTVVIDDASQKTNLPMGSVTYAIPKKAEDVYVGEPVLVQEDSSIYRYEMRTLNLENGTGTVVDPSVTNGQPITVAVKDYVPKIVITIAYIGYLQVALKSTEGIIILGLGLLFLIILYVIAELWRKDKNRRDEEDEEDEEDDEEEDDEEEVPVRKSKEVSRSGKERARKLKEEDDEDEEEERFRRKDRKKKKTEKRKVHTGGFVDEIDEDDDEDEDDEESERREPVKEAHESLKKGIAAATTDTEEAEEDLSPAEAVYRKLEEENKRAAREKLQQEAETVRTPAKKAVPTLESEADIQKNNSKKEKAPEDLSEKSSEVHRRAIPGYTAAELADKAKKAGDSPDVVKDDVTEITLFDYSDILDSDQSEK